MEGLKAHYCVFTEELVVKRKYLSEEELAELIALTSMLPGPSSTQTIAAIGLKLGGPKLALLTMLVWALPVVTLMSVLSFLYVFLDTLNVSPDILNFIGPMAVGFIAIAAWRIGRKVVTDRLTLLVFITAAVSTLFIRSLFVYPAVLAVGGFVGTRCSQTHTPPVRITLRPRYGYLAVFLLTATLAPAAAVLTGNHLAGLFERFIRYGYLVIGGGQVVIPYMYSDLVEIYSFMTSGKFLTGFGLVQGLPGPMFSFSAYAGGLAARGGSSAYQAIGAVTAAVGIFLPGLLLILFVYPLWEQLRQVPGIASALRGITAAAAGLIAAAGVVLFLESVISWAHLATAVATTALLLGRRVPAPLIVAAAIILGVFAA